MTNVSSTNLNQCLGGGSGTKSFSFKIFQIQISHYGTDQGSHSHIFNLFIEFVLKWKIGIMQAEP